MRLQATQTSSPTGPNCNLVMENGANVSVQTADHAASRHGWFQALRTETSLWWVAWAGRESHGVRLKRGSSAINRINCAATKPFPRFCHVPILTLFQLRSHWKCASERQLFTQSTSQGCKRQLVEIEASSIALGQQQQVRDSDSWWRPSMISRRVYSQTIMGWDKTSTLWWGSSTKRTHFLEPTPSYP